MSDLDYRGSNMSAIEEAHRKAHQADTRRDIAPMCSHCGMGQRRQQLQDIPIAMLQVCGRCKSVQYCCRECQVADWPEHKLVCKKVAKDRKAQKKATRKLSKSAIQQQVNDIGGDLPDQGKRIIEMLETTAADDQDDGTTACACAIRLGEDLPLLMECHKLADAFYPVLRTFLEKDLKLIQLPATGKGLALPSWSMAMAILRCFPGEDGFAPTQPGGGIPSYNEERSAAYFGACWKAHLDICVGLWTATCKGSSDLYVPCKDLWRQLTSCLIHQSVARAIFESYTTEDDTLQFSNAQSPRLKPLLGMLDLNDMADDLEGLTNQVAALLVLHARKIGASAAQLERSVMRKMERYAKMQWRGMSLVIAKEMIDKKRQLTTPENRRVMEKIRRSF